MKYPVGTLIFTLKNNFKKDKMPNVLVEKVEKHMNMVSKNMTTLQSLILIYLFFSSEAVTKS